MPILHLDADGVQAFMDAIGAAQHVCVDTEFHAERRYLPDLHLLQVHIPAGSTWLIDPHIEGLVAAIAPALRTVSWIVHGGRQDLRLLHHALGGVPNVVLDTQHLAGLISPVYPASFRYLAQTYLDAQPDKAATLSDWSRRPLSAQQIAYAAEDVIQLSALFEVLAPRVRDAGRWDAALAAGKEAIEDAIAPDGSRLWQRFSGSRALTPQQACVLQELAHWREGIAKERNQPARSCVSDGVLVDLAKRQPHSVDALRANRRLPKSVARTHGTTLVELIQRASVRPKMAWPRTIARYSKTDARFRLVDAFVATIGIEHNLAAQLLLPPWLHHDLAVQDALPPLGWRTPFLEGPLTSLFTGSSAVGIVDGAPQIVALPTDP